MARSVGRARSSRTILASCSALAVLAVAACGGGGGGDSTDASGISTRHFNVYELSPSTSFLSGLTPWTEAVTERTNGAHTFEIYWSSSLVPPAEHVSALSSGVADMGVLYGSYLPAETPVANWLSGLASIAGKSYPIDYYAAIGAHAEFGLTDPALLAEFEKLNLKLLAPYFLGFQYDLLCREPISSLADLKGRTVRVAGEIWAGEARALGMEPVFMSSTESYEAMQRGVVDCDMQQPHSFATQSTWEVADYFLPVGASGFNPTYVVMNLDVWNDLSDEERRIIVEEIRHMWVDSMRTEIKDRTRFAVDGPAQHNIKILSPIAEVTEAVRNHQEAEIQRLLEKAPGIDDPQAVVDRYRELMEKWQQLLRDELDLPEADPNAPQGWIQVIDEEWDPEPFVDLLMERLYSDLSLFK